MAQDQTHNDQLPRLSVIIPAYNAAMHLPRCLESLRLSDYHNFEVIVVDDHSTDNTKQIAERYGAYCVRTPRSLGPAGARNMGIGYAQASIAVFVDADVTLPPNALALIANDFAQNTQLAAVFGAYDDKPAWNNFFSQYKNLMHSLIHLNSSERAVTFWAGCGAVRKEIFCEFGGFDADRYHKPSIEDIEFGYRLSGSGQEIKLNKQLQVKHLKRWTFRSLLKADIFYRAVPWTNLIFETRHLPGDLNLTSKARISAGLVGLLSLGPLVLFLQALKVLPQTFLTVLAAASAVVMLLIVLNWDVYRWFARMRGWWFAVRVIPMHWLYYFYSGLVFAVCGAMTMSRLVIAYLLPGSWGSRVASHKSRGR